MEERELSQYMFIGTRGILIFHSDDHPNYGCIPVIGVNSDSIWLVDQDKTYFDETE